MGDSLAQFLVWWDSPDGKERAVAEQESTYRIAQRAFEAGQQTQPPVPLQPSRDALEDKRAAFLRKYAPPQPLEPLPAPDYVQQGTVTGRIPREPTFTPLKEVARPHFTGPRPFVEIYAHPPGLFEHVETAWKGPESPFDALPTLDVRRARAEAGLESPATMQFRAIEPDEDDRGPRGPVVTPLLGSEDL